MKLERSDIKIYRKVLEKPCCFCSACCMIGILCLSCYFTVYSMFFMNKVYRPIYPLIILCMYNDIGLVVSYKLILKSQNVSKNST